jgi:hypothetical protein
MVGAMSLQTVSTASGPLNFRQFAMSLEMASMLRLKVDTALAVAVLSKSICSRPCVGAANAGFLGWKEWQGNQCRPPSTLGFILASAAAGS